MSYTRVNWNSTTTFVSAENLNVMDKGIKDLDTNMGDVAALKTSAKTIVPAINEINNNLINQYLLHGRDIKQEYGAVFSITNNALFQTRDGSRVFCPLFLDKSVLRMEVTITDNDLWLLLGGLENQFTILKCTDTGAGALFNVLDKTEALGLATIVPSYTPIVGDIIAIERYADKFVLYKKNADLTFTEYLTVLDSVYPTAYYISNSNSCLGIVAHNLNIGSNGIAKDIKLNFTSESIQYASTSKPAIDEWNVLGDSFTVLDVFQSSVKEHLGIGTVNSYGVSGSMITDPNFDNANAMSVRYSSMSNTANITTVLGGTNDWSYSAPIGTINDTTRATFYGALRIIIEGILTSNSKTGLMFFTPTQRSLVAAGETSGYTANSLGFYLTDYVDAIKKMCELYAIPVLDLHSVSGINIKTMSTYTFDDLHPNQLGSGLISRTVANFIKQYI